MSDQDSAFAWVRIRVGSDDEVYYTAMYANGEAGPRSEGYVVHNADGTVNRERSILSAQRAATRDFPTLSHRIDLDDEPE